MVEKEWVEELTEKTVDQLNAKVYRIMTILLAFKQEQNVPNFKKQQSEFWDFCKKYLSQIQNDVGKDSFISLLFLIP